MFRTASSDVDPNRVKFQPRGRRPVCCPAASTKVYLLAKGFAGFVRACDWQVWLHERSRSAHDAHWRLMPVSTVPHDEGIVLR